MRWWLVGALVVLGVVTAVGFALGRDSGTRAFGAVEPSDRAAESPLVGAPDVDGGTSREVYLRDPAGQVDRLAAGGDLVAWSVRTPPDRIDTSSDAAPIVFPTSSRVVVADESGGARLAVDFPGRWISALRMIRGVAGDAQLAVRSCTSRRATSCHGELLALADGYPPTITARGGSRPITDAALEGTLDGDFQLVARPETGSRCLPRLEVLSLGLLAMTDGTVQPAPERTLPPLPETERGYPDCKGLEDLLLTPHAAFATVGRSNPKLGFDRSIVYGLDLGLGKTARWHQVQAPYRGSDGSYGLAVGPAVGLNDLFWEELNTEAGDSASYDLDAVDVSRDLRIPPVDGKTANTSEPIAPGGRNVCAIAATSAAVYELSNPRCAADGAAGTGGAEIRRVVNPAFRPSTD